MALSRDARAPRTLAPADLDELWRFFEGFVRRDRAAFEEKLRSQQSLVRYRDADGVLRGFVVVDTTVVSHGGRRFGNIGTPYCAFDPGIRGSNLCQREGLLRWAAEKVRHPLRPYYWVFTASTYKSYLLLPRNLREYWPRPGVAWPAREAAIVAAVMSDDPDWDATAHVVRRGGRSCYREGVCALDPAALADPDVRFYAALNPGQLEGDTVPCLVPLTVDNMAWVVGHMARRVARRGRALGAADRAGLTPPVV